MHELVLVNGIIESVIDVARREGRRVKSFKISVGELASFDIELIKFLLDEVRKGTEIENAKIIVETTNAIVECRTCNSTWGFNEIVKALDENEKEMIHFIPELLSSFTRCPGCGSRDLGVVSGRGIEVEYIELQ
jgi:hydrogenase nickel incorporation protein HypA/HybF